MKQNNMRHYFIDRERTEDEYFTFTDEFGGVKFTFNSANDVFSKNSIDEGSRTLIDTFIKSFGDKSGTLLDLCSGYGAIGVILSRFTDFQITMTDINHTAVELSRNNVRENRVKVYSIVEGDGLSAVDKFDYIVTNPPIKTGKELLFRLIKEGADHLNSNGVITLVIRKSHGEESLQKYMKEIYGNVEILKRNKGYYILSSVKKS